MKDFELILLNNLEENVLKMKKILKIFEKLEEESIFICFRISVSKNKMFCTTLSFL
jgi:hypothetical protein